MFLLKKPLQSEITLVTTAKCKCCNCDAEVVVDAPNAEAAARLIAKQGWHAYERSDEVGGNACPSCIEEMRQLEAEDEAAAEQGD